MIAVDLTQAIREQVCSEIQIDRIDADRLSVAMPLAYGDGDTCRIIIEPKTDGSYAISDGGLVHAAGLIGGVDLLTSGHIDRFRRLAGLYGVSEAAGELTMNSDLPALGDSIFSFVQACLELSRLADLPPESSKKAKPFRAAFSKVVEKALSGSDFEANWHHQRYDPGGVYTVDYARRDMAGNEWFIFGAGSPVKCWRSVSSVQHYRAAKYPHQTVFAYSHSVESDPSAFAALADNADYKFSIESELRQLREFLRSGVGPI